MKLLNLKDPDVEIIQLNQNHNRDTFIYEPKIVTALDPRQGYLEDSGIIAVISALVLVKFDFSQVIAYDRVTNNYGVNLFIGGQKSTVQVNDTVTYRDDKVLVSYSNENLLYVSLIEKALALVYNGYQNIEYFEAHEAISMITNCNYRLLRHKEISKELLLDALKSLGSQNIIIASFDNAFGDTANHKDNHHKYFTVLEAYSIKEETWVLVRDPQLFSNFESKDIRKSGNKQVVMAKLLGRFELQKESKGYSILSLKEYMETFHFSTVGYINVKYKMKNYHGIVNDHESDFNMFTVHFAAPFEGFLGTFSYSDKLINTLFNPAILEESVHIDMNEILEQYPYVRIVLFDPENDYKILAQTIGKEQNNCIFTKVPKGKYYLMVDDRAITNKYNLYSPYSYSNLSPAQVNLTLIKEKELKYDLLSKLMVNYAYDYVKQTDYSVIRYTPDYLKCFKYQSKPKDIPIKYGILLMENRSDESYFSDKLQISQLSNVRFVYQFHSEDKYNTSIEKAVHREYKSINTTLQASKNLNMSNVVSKNVSMLNDRSMVSITIAKTHFHNKVLLSPGNYYVLVFKADNPNLHYAWDITSIPQEIDKYEYLSNKKPLEGQRVHSNFQPCNCHKNMHTILKERSKSPPKKSKKQSADVSQDMIERF